MYDNTIILCVGLGLLGLVAGSFAGAQVWRLRLAQLLRDKKDGEAFDVQELKQLSKLKGRMRDDRSRCLHCGHTLAWYDLVPLVSWCSTKGQCRYCHASIGRFEPTIEILMACFFVVSYLLWPFGHSGGVEIAQFAIWLLSGILLAMLFVYDAKWYLLPDRINWLYVLLGVFYALLAMIQGYADVWSLVGSVVIMSGLYLVLYLVSKGKWIGFGDVKLGLGLGLFLLDWQWALLALFLANLLGTLFVIPGLVTKKLHRTTPVPFGPFLILGTIIAVLAGPMILSYYVTTLFL